MNDLLLTRPPWYVIGVLLGLTVVGVLATLNQRLGALGGGVLIGYGAKLAGGCTSGNGLCGTSLGSPASFAATATFMATAIGATFAIAWLT